MKNHRLPQQGLELRDRMMAIDDRVVCACRIVRLVGVELEGQAGRLGECLGHCRGNRRELRSVEATMAEHVEDHARRSDGADLVRELFGADQEHRPVDLLKQAHRFGQAIGQARASGDQIV